MPCSACGSGTSAISPPSSSIRFSVASKTARTPGLDRVVGQLGGDAEAQARRGPRGWARSTPPSIPTEVESQGSRPCSAASSSAASVTSRVSGPHWSSEEAKAIIP